MTRSLLLVAVLFFLLGGCGSKISEFNYFKIEPGDSEARVESLLGPGILLSTDAGQDVMIKQWAHGGLRITITFQNGRVIARAAAGLRSGDESYRWPQAATQPTVTGEDELGHQADH